MSGKADKLISMQDAIEAICDEIMSRFDVGITEGYELVEDALSGLPSVEPKKVLVAEVKLSIEDIQDAVDNAVEKIRAEMEEPERKKGKWIWQTENRYVCSECGHHTQVDELFEEPMYAFCPYCSTSMLDKDGNVRYER